MKKTLWSIILAIAACMLTGALAGWLQSDSIRTWYPLLVKSPLTPPNTLFPVVWTILYICMGISIGLIASSQDQCKKSLMSLFGVQLVLNFLWSILFFCMQSPMLGMIDIVLLEIALVVYAFKAWPRFKVSSLLFIPYIAWVGFAAYLNLYILLTN